MYKFKENEIVKIYTTKSSLREVNNSLGIISGMSVSDDGQNSVAYCVAVLASDCITILETWFIYESDLISTGRFFKGKIMSDVTIRINNENNQEDS